MSEIIQVRGVPKKTHAALVREAKAAGLSLNKYLLGEFEKIAAIARNRELFREADAIPGKRPTSQQVLDAVRHGREERERQLDDRLRRIRPR